MPSNIEKRTGTAQSGAMEKRTGGESPDLGPIGFQQQLDKLDQKRKMIEAKARPEKGIGDFLGSPEGLIKLGLALGGGIAGAATGNQNLMAAGAGLGMGTLEGAGGMADKNNMARQKEIDSLTAMVDKQQQRLVTLLQSQPGMFLDDTGQNLVEPGEWRDILMMDVPINVHALTVNAKKDSGAFKAEAANIKTIIDEAIKLENVGMLRDGLRRYSNLHQLGWTEGQVEDYSHMAPEKILGAMLEENTLESVLAMNKEAQITGKSLWDPELEASPVRRPNIPQPSTPAEHAFEKAQVKFMEWLEVGDHLALYEQNPWEAQDMAFEEDPAGQAALQDGSRFFRRGSDAEELRQKALVETWGQAAAMYMTQNEGLTAPDSERRKIVRRVAEEGKMLVQVGRNVTSLREDVTTAKAVGGLFARKYGLDADGAGYYGSRIVIKAKSMMQSLGMEAHKQSDDTKKEFQAAAGAIIAYENKLTDSVEEVTRLTDALQSKYAKKAKE